MKRDFLKGKRVKLKAGEGDKLLLETRDRKRTTISWIEKLGWKLGGGAGSRIE